jgi:hypothetical protein
LADLSPDNAILKEVLKGKWPARPGESQEGLAGAWRADHQDVMTPSGDDFEGALDVLLSLDFLEVHQRFWRDVFGGKVGLRGLAKETLISGVQQLGAAAREEYRPGQRGRGGLGGR